MVHPGGQAKRAREMRVAIIGAGLQCRRRAPVIKESKDDQLVVIASLHQEHAQEMASKMDCEAADDWRSSRAPARCRCRTYLHATACPCRDRYCRNEGWQTCALREANDSDDQPRPSSSCRSHRKPA